MTSREVTPKTRKALCVCLCALTGICLVAGAQALAAQSVVPPVPPIRSPDVSAPATMPAVAPAAVVLSSAEDNNALRTQVLASGHVVGEVLPPINDKGGCGIEAPLRLEAIVLTNGAKVVLMPAVVMRASLASAVADWVRDDLAPAIAKGDQLASIEGTGAYECRSRDRITGAKLSEHATGDALDLHALRTKNGKLFAIAQSKDDPSEAKSFRALMKRTACLRFATVLGPGADLYHQAHLHVDLAVRRNNMHLCQWDVGDTAASANP
jgi:hypothetical protein